MLPSMRAYMSLGPTTSMRLSFNRPRTPVQSARVGPVPTKLSGAGEPIARGAKEPCKCRKESGPSMTTLNAPGASPRTRTTPRVALQMMQAQETFADKHVLQQNDRYIAAQEACNRFGEHGNAKVSTTIYNTNIDELNAQVAFGIVNRDDPLPGGSRCFPFIHAGRTQWRCTLPGHKYVSCTKKYDYPYQACTCKVFENGDITVVAERGPNDSQGQLSHFETASGEEVQTLELQDRLGAFGY